MAFNGKFLAAAQTGVHRVARELIRGTDALLSEDAPFNRAWRLYRPRDAFQELHLANIRSETIGITTWQPWEQIELPLASRSDLLINLCNLGPLAHRNAITMIHDAQVFISPESYGPAFRTWYQFALPFIGRRARRILTVSEYSRRQLAEHGVADYDRIAVIHNGVDHLSKVAPEKATVRQLGLEERGYVLALANVQRHKNIALLIKSFEQTRLSGLKLVLVGKAHAGDFARSGVVPPPSVTFVGAVEDAQFRALMESALCLAFPSTTEGFGLPPLEAMTVGCPVVVAPCGALPEVCEQAALYASPHEVEDWVEKICRLRDDEEARSKLVEQGHLQAAKFTWRSSAEKLLREVKTIAA